MRFRATLLLILFPLFAGCHRETGLRKQILGTWTRDGGYDITFAADGSFVSEITNLTQKLTYQGTWELRGSDVVYTVTNCITQGTTNFQAVGSVDRMVIVQSSQSDLVWSNSGQMISLKRKK